LISTKNSEKCRSMTMTKPGMWQSLQTCLKSWKKKLNLWAMALDNSSGPAHLVPTEKGLDSTTKFLQPKDHSTPTKFISEPSITTILTTTPTPSFEEMFSNTMILSGSVKETPSGTSSTTDSMSLQPLTLLIVRENDPIIPLLWLLELMLLIIIMFLI